MSQNSYLPTPPKPPAGSYVPTPKSSVPTPRPAPYRPPAGIKAGVDEEIDVKFDEVRAIPQKDGFFNIEYKLKLPQIAPAYTVRMAIAKENVCRDPVADKDYIANRLPSLLIPPRPGPQGRRGRTGVNLTEHQAKLLLWHMMNFGAWGHPVTAYIVVYAVTRNGSLRITVSNPVVFHCPLEPVSGIGFEMGEVDTAPQLGQTLNNRRIPYETEGCLLLSLNLFGINLLFFHSNKKLITAANDKLRRGVNCITFVDAAIGTDFDSVMGCTGREVANRAGAPIVLDGVQGDEMRAYFNDADRATWEARSFVFWWDEHVVVIHRGIVCEYARSAGRYRETPAQEYLRQFRGRLLYLAQL